MTRKDYFDLLVRTSAGGEFPATHDAGITCSYRMHDGRRCAVGLILPDSVYEVRMEGNTVEALVKDGYIKDLSWVPDGMTLKDLGRVQSIHDSLSGYDTWGHEEFVRRIRSQPCFQNLEEAAA